MGISIEQKGAVEAATAAGRATGSTAKKVREQAISAQEASRTQAIAEQRRFQQTNLDARRVAEDRAMKWELEKMELRSKQSFAQELRREQFSYDRENRAEEWAIEKMTIASRLDFAASEKERTRELEEIAAERRRLQKATNPSTGTVKKNDPWIIQKHFALDQRELELKTGARTQFLPTSTKDTLNQFLGDGQVGTKVRGADIRQFGLGQEGALDQRGGVVGFGEYSGQVEPTAGDFQRARKANEVFIQNSQTGQVVLIPKNQLPKAISGGHKLFKDTITPSMKKFDAAEKNNEVYVYSINTGSLGRIPKNKLKEAIDSENFVVVSKPLEKEVAIEEISEEAIFEFVPEKKPMALIGIKNLLFGRGLVDVVSPEGDEETIKREQLKEYERLGYVVGRKHKRGIFPLGRKSAEATSDTTADINSGFWF